MTYLEHSHDVSIIWEFWPFNVAIPQIVRVLLTGYGINPIFTLMYDISFWPIMIWNGIFGMIGVPVNIIFNFLYAIINGPTSYIVFICEIIKYVLMTFRSVTGWSKIETFVVIAAMVGVSVWLTLELFAETPADGESAATSDVGSA